MASPHTPPVESPGPAQPSSSGATRNQTDIDADVAATHSFPVSPEALSAYLEALDLHLPASVTVSLGTLRDALLGYLSEVEWMVREKLGVEASAYEQESEADDDRMETSANGEQGLETDSLMGGERNDIARGGQGGPASSTTAHDLEASRYGALASTARRRGGEVLRRTLSGGGPSSSTSSLQLPIPSPHGLLAHLNALKEDVAACLPSLPTLPELRHLGDAALHSMPTAPSAESLQTLYLPAVARHNLSLAIPGLFQTLPQRLFLLQTTLRGVQHPSGGHGDEDGNSSASRDAAGESLGNRERVMQLVHKLLPSEEWAGWEKLGWEDPMHSSWSPSGLATPTTDPSLSFFARPTGHGTRRHSHGANLARIISGGWSDWVHVLPNNPLTRQTSIETEQVADEVQPGEEDAAEEEPEPEWLFPNKTPRAAFKRQQSYEVSVQVRRDEAARRASRRRAASISSSKGDRRDSVGSATESLKGTGNDTLAPAHTFNLEETDPGRDWAYIAEGGANIVYAFVGKEATEDPLSGKVIRIRKRSSRRSSARTQSEDGEAESFFHNQMLPLLVPERYLAEQATAKVPCSWIRRLERAHVGSRDQSRLGNESELSSGAGPEGGDADGPGSGLMDVMIIDNLLGGEGHIAMEVKPKAGYLPSVASLSQRSPSAAVKATHCRFCLHRRMRIRQTPQASQDDGHSDLGRTSSDADTAHTGDKDPSLVDAPDESTVSQAFHGPESSQGSVSTSHWAQWEYCPLDLYSGDRGRVGRAVSELVKGWEASRGESNSFRLFAGGVKVMPHHVVDGFIRNATLGCGNGFSLQLDDAASKLADGLTTSSVMETLKRLQRGLLGDEDVERLWNDVVAWSLETGQDPADSIALALREPTRSELSDLMAYVGLLPRNAPAESIATSASKASSIRFRLLAFAIAATFKDCSIIIRYPLEQPGSAHQTGDGLAAPVDHQFGAAVIKVVDLDLKPMAKFRQWLELDRRILANYAQMHNLGTDIRTMTTDHLVGHCGKDASQALVDTEDLAGAIARAKAAALAAALQAAEVDPEAAAQLELEEEVATEDAKRQMLAAYGPSISDVLLKSEQGTRLIGYEDLPTWMQNNEYLHFGYRFIPFHPKFGPLPLLASILQWHNETINIHTHLVPTMVLLAFVIPYTIVYPPLTDAAPLDIIVLMTFLLSAASCLLSSAGWHLLSGCSHRGVFEWGACVDYVGISWLISASIMTVFYNGFYCQGRTLLLYCVLTLGSAVTGSILPFQQWFNERRNKGKRILFFLSSSFVALAPLTHLALVHGLPKMLAFASPILPSICSYLGGLAFYAFHFPESRWPGKLDCLGNSHQIWHLAIVLAVYLHYEGSLAIFESRHSMSCALPYAGTPMSEHLRGFSAYFGAVAGEVKAIS